jgi:DNA polymerase-3 subunit beta
LNFLIETESSKIKLISTDLQMGVKHYMKAEVEKEGSVTIPAKKFAEILHTLQAGKKLNISVEPDGKVLVKCDKSKFIIIGTPKSEYPVLPEFNKNDAFDAPTSLLIEMIKKTIFAASTDETRYVLNGVFWVASGGVLEMVATDGRRLAAAKSKMLPASKEFRAVVPTKILQELLRVLSHEEGEEKVSIGITDNQVGFQTKSTTMISRLVEGSFPNYEQVIPSKKDIQVSINTKDFLQITRQAALAAPDRGGSVKFTLKKGALHVAAASQTIQFEDEVAVNYNGDDFTIAFNPEYVVEGLKAMDTEKVVLSMTTPVNPALIEPEGKEGYQYVVMPMRA